MITYEEIKRKIQRYQQMSFIKKRLIVLPKIPLELDELQMYVINSHIEVEKLMAEMIRVKLWVRVYDKTNPLPATKLLGALYQVVEYVPYKEKARILSKLEPLFKPLQNRINNLTKIRNKFAHTELLELVKEYNIDDVNGVQKILHKYELIEKLFDDMVKTAQGVKDYGVYSTFIQELYHDVKKQ